MTRHPHAALAVIPLLGTFWLAGCGGVPFLTEPQEAPSDFVGIELSSFSKTNPINVQRDAASGGASCVDVPEDLLETAAEEVVFEVTSEDIKVVPHDPTLLDGVDGLISTAGLGGNSLHVSVTFHIGPEGEDACASDLVIGPIGVTIANGKVHVQNGRQTLTDEVRALIRTGHFEICAQTLADFDGYLLFERLSLLFGDLGPTKDPVTLCHIPPRNPSNRHTITVGPVAAAMHLAHGDHLGACEDDDIGDGDDADDDGDDEPGDDSGEDDGDEGDDDNDGDDGDDVEKDTDNDGVPDSHDRCPDTVPEYKADEEGCSCAQLDEDGDGTKDCDDLCPDTPEGTPVDQAGCAVAKADDDGDGVSDGGDSCPDTPEDEDADSDGCSCSQRDGDNDGVSDCDDACPLTPQGESVGEDGCVPAAPDADDDGVPDDADMCPDTPFDEDVDDQGCSPSQGDEDGDGVVNADDLCPATPAGWLVDVNGCAVMAADAGTDVVLDEVGCVTLQGSATAGTPPYTFSWSAPGWEGSMAQNPVVVPSATTVYTLTVTDWSSPPAVATDTVTVTVLPATNLTYAIEEIGSLSSNTAYPAAMNNAGDVVGYYYTDAWEKHAFLYRNGVMTDLGTLGGTESYARDINDYGEVVGQSRTAAGDLHAFFWDASGGMSDLGTLGGSISIAYGINADGYVVGEAMTATSVHAFLHDGTGMTDIGTTGYFQSGAYGINDVGQIVGTYLELGSDQQAFLYDSGAFTDLGSPLLTGSRAHAVNDNGMVIGYSWGASGNRSFLWVSDYVIDLGAPAGLPRVYAWDINSTGQIVGYGSSDDGTVSRALIFAGGTLHELTDLLQAGHGWDYLNVAFAINDDGQIAGYGRVDGVYCGYLLTPSP